MSNKKNITVCLTPDIFCNYNIPDDSIIVVVDLLRATTVISTAFHYGIKDIMPVSDLLQAKEYLNKDNYIVAAERDAKPMEDFEYGNSPFQYMNDDINGKRLVLTTTNGTKAINCAQDYHVITSCFINLDVVSDFLIHSSRDVVVLCSGWKGLFNLEDSVFAGCLSEKLILSNKYQTNCDSVLASRILYNQAQGNLFDFLSDSAHRRRLKSLNIEKDTEFCLDPSIKSDIIPTLVNGKLVRG